MADPISITFTDEDSATDDTIRALCAKMENDDGRAVSNWEVLIAPSGGVNRAVFSPDDTLSPESDVVVQSFDDSDTVDDEARKFLADKKLRPLIYGPAWVQNRRKLLLIGRPTTGPLPPPLLGKLIFNKTKAIVANRGVPHDSFLQQLVEWGKAAPNAAFEPTAGGEIDVYDSVSGRLGPYNSSPYRRACMLEVMRVLAGFESSWNWNEGVDTSNPNSNTPQSEEAGAFQVSADSLPFGRDLADLVRSSVGTLDPRHFQAAMKADHPLAMEYIARLLLHTIRHNGPVRDHEINPFLSRDAVAEFQQFLTA